MIRRPSHRAARPATAALAVLAAMVLGVTSTSSADAATISFDGHEYWLNGINIPWKQFGCDVGTHPTWGHVYDAAWFESFFAQCKTHGINSVRFWIHCDGRATPEFDSSGYVTGLDAETLTDFSDILQRANAHGVMVMPCLWSFDMTDDRTGSAGPYAGMHHDLIADDAKTDSYVQNALIPMVQHLADAPNLIAWEIINEPEWSVNEPGIGNTDYLVTKLQMQRFCAKIAAAIHQNSSQMVTLGAASLKWNSDVSPAEGNWWSDASLQAAYASTDAYLDFYQIHYYDWMYDPSWGYDPFDLAKPTSFWGLDKPCIVGEIPGTESGHYSVAAMVDNSYANGYAGVMFWSYASDYGWDAVVDDLKTFRDAHPDIVDFTPGTGDVTITLTSPTVTTSTVAPASLTLSAQTVSSGPTVESVSFTVDGNVLDTDTTPADGWSAAWAQSQPGIFEVSAFATVTDGGSAYAGTVTVAVTGPYLGTPQPVPGVVEAEAYDVGLEGYAYHDTEAVNKGGELRDDGVDVEPDGAGGYCIAYIEDDEWIRITVDVAASGPYDVAVASASIANTGVMRIVVDDSYSTDTISQVDTGGWTTWQDVPVPNGLYLDAGLHVLTIAFDAGYFNLDSIVFTPATDTDGDGMPDAWETANGFDPADPLDGDLDSDGDGLLNKDEYAWGTDPGLIDSDGDGFTDAYEVLAGYDPLDPSVRPWTATSSGGCAPRGGSASPVTTALLMILVTAAAWRLTLG